MYEVRWAQHAVADLQNKVRTPVVRRYLFAVGRVALDRHPGDWGGRLEDGWWWRRGITPQDEAEPDAIPGGAVGDEPPEMPYEFVLVYLRAVAAHVPRPFLVLGVVTNTELAAGSAAALFVDGRAAHWAPRPAPPQGRRVIRRRGRGEDRR